MKASELIAAGRAYLLALPGVTESILDNHLTNWRRQKKRTLNAIFRSMLDHATNRQGMRNYIGDITNHERVLFGFNPRKVLRRYGTWRNVCDAVRKHRVQLPAR